MHGLFRFGDFFPKLLMTLWSREPNSVKSLFSLYVGYVNIVYSCHVRTEFFQSFQTDVFQSAFNHTPPIRDVIRACVYIQSIRTGDVGALLYKIDPTTNGKIKRNNFRPSPVLLWSLLIFPSHTYICVIINYKPSPKHSIKRLLNDDWCRDPTVRRCRG